MRDYNISHNSHILYIHHHEQQQQQQQQKYTKREENSNQISINLQVNIILYSLSTIAPQIARIMAVPTTIQKRSLNL